MTTTTPITRDRVSLPMYDFVGVRAETDRLCRTVLTHASALASSGPMKGALSGSEISNTFRLGEGRDQATAESVWADHRLLLSQICGQNMWDMQQQQKQSLHILASPCYSAEGCTEHYYCGRIIVRADSSFENIHNLAGTRVAVNDYRSYSGCVGLRAAVANALHLQGPVNDGGKEDGETSARRGCTGERRVNFFHPVVLVTGSHRESIQAVLAGKVDCACIDAVTLALLLTSEIDTDCLRIIGETPRAPAPPFVVPLDMAGSEVASVLLESLQHAASFSPSSFVKLFLKAIVPADPNEYRDTFTRLNARADLVALDGCWKQCSSIGGCSTSAPAYFSHLDLCGYSFDILPPALFEDREKEVRQWMSRGMLLHWAFNHEEANVCFKTAIELLPPLSASRLEDGGDRRRCVIHAMAYWAASHSLATNYNKWSLDRTEIGQARDNNGRALEALNLLKSTAASEGEGDLSLQHVCLKLVKAQRVRLQVIPVETTHSAADSGEDEDLSEASFKLRDKAYAQEMETIFSTVQGSGKPYEIEFSALFGESLMQLAPWKMWQKDTMDLSRRIQSVIEPALGMVMQEGGGSDNSSDSSRSGSSSDSGTAVTRNRHPGLAHFHVHLLEMAGPVSHSLVLRAVPSAHALRSQWPACGHLLHMASHIDVHLGDFQAAVRANLAAICADEDFANLRGSNNYYHTYRVHSGNQLNWAANFCGMSKVALAAAEAIITCTPAPLREKYADFLEPLEANIWFSLVRFGRWTDVLERLEPPLVPPGTLPPPPPPPSAVSLPPGDNPPLATTTTVDNNNNNNNNNFVSLAVARWAKAVAFASLGRLKEACQARSAFLTAAAAVPETRHVHVVPSSSMLEVASKMLDGEISYRQAALLGGSCGFEEDDGSGNQREEKGNAAAAAAADTDADADVDPFAEAFALLREAVALDEGLPYDEPWAWMTPVAHALGALLLEQGKLEEAAKVYRRDLERWPNNLWALGGLKKCLEAKKEAKEEKAQEQEEEGKKGPPPPTKVEGSSGGSGVGGGSEAACKCGPADKKLSVVPPAPSALGELGEVVRQLRRAASQADIDLGHSCFCAGLLPAAAAK